ncbi:hypothetical protein [Streptomyces sp. NPDC048845]
MPDHFDRLLARHAPAVRAALAPADGAAPARVRPRLPGPFERIESLRSAEPAAEPEATAALLPPGPAPAVPRAVPVREREIRTDHHTVVRTEPAAPGETARPAPAPALPPLLVPAADISPERPADADGLGPARPAAPAGTPGPAPAAPAPRAPRPAAAAPAAAARLLPRTAEAAAARDAARSASGRRRPRTAERTVHVQIGRLEVAAAGAPGTERAASGRSQRSGRPAPAVSLADYLSRGERNS